MSGGWHPAYWECSICHERAPARARVLLPPWWCVIYVDDSESPTPLCPGCADDEEQALYFREEIEAYDRFVRSGGGVDEPEA